ncbi:hypothetical protein LXA43DRAFT_445959 [Ganoderma leucocontextum]|nr:hypothetical protein LXA43DRAFT_445959 [Ganoderma leucocontextum]
MSGKNSPTVVIDDTNVHYNTSRDAGQAIAPSSSVINSVTSAKASPWNYTLAVLTSQISFWYNVTGYNRIAVYGALIPPSNPGITAWANYTVNGNYTAANITTSTHIVTDFPLFTSVELDPNEQYNLTVDIWASPDAPYLFDYLLAFSPPDPTPLSTSSTASSTSTAQPQPTNTAPSSSNSINIPHPITIIGALAGACALLLALWLLTLCCWCRSRGSKPKTTEESMGPEPPFNPRPTVNKSATLVSAKASRRADSLLQSPLQASSTTLAPALGLSLVPERAPTPVSVASASRPATTYLPDHGQFAAGPTHHRSATLPIQHHFATPYPSAIIRDVDERPIIAQHMLPHAVSMPRLGTGMSTPTTLPLPTPFEHSPAGQILRPESPLRNPYDDLYGPLDAPTPLGAAATASGSSTPTGTRSGSPALTTPAPAPSAMPTSASASTIMALSTSGPSTSASASAPVQPEPTTAAPVPAPAKANSNKQGASEYPPEKREVRLEPPAPASASSPEREDFADSPPAYSS